MPKTRTKFEHQDKANQIVEAAIRRLRAGGVEALSVAALARELSVAQNTIYWYFPTRDHLLAAALGRMAQRIIGEGASPDATAPPLPEAKPTSVKATILLAVDRFAEVQPLLIAVRERARSSPVLQEFDAGMTDYLHRALREAFTGCVPEAEMDLAIDTFLLASDGCYARNLGKEQRRAVMGFVLERLGITDGPASS